MLIYKIMRLVEWAECEQTGQFDGSVHDRRDGFIHLSTREQMPGTLAKHYKTEEKVVIAAADETAFGNALKWEVSRGGDKFPHLYAPLPASSLVGVWHIERREDGFDLAALDTDA